jgi:hypothetical protein
VVALKKVKKEKKNPTAVDDRTRVTVLGEFSPVGDCFTLDIFWKLPKKPTFLATFSTVVHNLTKKVVGLHFGRFFNKLIWSPRIELGE